MLRHKRIREAHDPFRRDPKGSAFTDQEAQCVESTVLLHEWRFTRRMQDCVDHGLSRR